MPSLLDYDKFPWHLAVARELHIVLCQLYPTSKGAMFIAQQAELDTSLIYADQAPYMLWKEILELAAASARTRALLERVREQQRTSPKVPFLDALLKDETPALDAEPRGELGAPEFIDGNDDIFENEALLYRDDLTLPIGRVNWMIGVLRKLAAVAPAVCKLDVLLASGARHGTGFRVAPGLLLTNAHVLAGDGRPPLKVTAEFGFDDDGRNGGLPSKAFRCDVATIKMDAANDWGIIGVESPLPKSIPTIALSSAAEPVLNEPAFIIQHPGGLRKRVGFVRNQITEITHRVMHYLTDTQEGSSGSPVLNDQGRIIALHHAGGRPQELIGKPPLRKNEGILIPVVMKGLAKRGIAVS